MVILIGGASHTGKTLLAQKLLERYRYPVLSLDLLKMGLIRSGQTNLTAEDDDLLVPYLWGIAKEMAKTALENEQNLIIEGCYIPFDWKGDFGPEHLSEIHSYHLVMSRDYLHRHAGDILGFGSVIERRLEGGIDFEELASENERILASCRKHGLPYQMIDDEYEVGRISFEPFCADDAHDAERLFHETVHAVNARDYTASQLDAWAPREEAQRDMVVEKLRRQAGVAARECGILIGFGTLDECGIDMLYVHKDRQGQGIARRILLELERMSADRGLNDSVAYASATARPFFEKMGYKLDYENVAVRGGVPLTNYRMSKSISPGIIGQASCGNPHQRIE